MISRILLIPLAFRARRQDLRRRDRDGAATSRLEIGEHHGNLNEHLTSPRMNRAALTLESICVPVIRSQSAPPVASAGQRVGAVGPDGARAGATSIFGVSRRPVPNAG